MDLLGPGRVLAKQFEDSRRHRVERIEASKRGDVQKNGRRREDERRSWLSRKHAGACEARTIPAEIPNPRFQVQIYPADFLQHRAVRYCEGITNELSFFFIDPTGGAFRCEDLRRCRQVEVGSDVQFSCSSSS